MLFYLLHSSGTWPIFDKFLNEKSQRFWMICVGWFSTLRDQCILRLLSFWLLFLSPFFLILLNKHQWYLMKLCHAVLIAVPIANLSSNYVPLCMMTRTCSEEKKNNCKMITIDSIFHIRTKISLTNFPNNKITVTFNFVWITVRLNPSLKHKLLTHSNHSKCASSVCIRRVSELQLTEKSM